MPSTAGPNDAASSGNGLTNLQVFLNGSDPNDYYNGALPSLTIGSGQFGALGQVLTVPVIVTPVTPNATDGGAYNAPVTLTVSSGGALLSQDPSGSNPCASLTVRATNTVPQSTGYPLDVAQVYVVLPNTVGDQSTITATVTTGGQTTSAQSWVMTFDGTLAAPTGLTATPVASDTVTLNWTPGNSSLGTTLQVSYDGGTTWVTLGVAAPGATSATVTGLGSDQQVLFQALTGGESLGASTTFNAATPASDPLPGQSLSAPTASATATPLSQPLLLADQSTGSLHWYGIPGFQDPNNRYLSASQTFTFRSPPSYDGMSDTYGDRIDPITGDDNITGGITPPFGSLTDWAQLSEGYGPPSYATIQSDTSANVMGYSYPGSGFTFDGTASLGDPYTFSQFLSNAQTQVPDFSGAYNSPAVGTYALTSGDTDVAVQDCSITKLQYKFQVNSDPNLVVCWSVVFTPDDGSTPTTQYMNWASQGATESPVYTIDPSTGTMTQSGGGVIPAAQPATQPSAKTGQYEVKPVVPQLQVTWGPNGGMVASVNKKNGTKHFVCPKAAGQYVVLTAGNLSNSDMTDNGGPYSFAFDPNVGAEVQDGTGLSWGIPTDAAGQYKVNLLQNGVVVDTLNVWVVWANGTPTQPQHTVFNVFAGSTQLSIGGQNIAYSGYFVRDTDPWKFQFTIQPASIISADPNADIPDLRGPRTNSPPGSDQTHPILGSQYPLSKGADRHWDVSRRVQVTLINPSLIPKNDFPAELALVYVNQPVATPDTPITFPTNPLIGNDDSGVGDEDNNPYAAFTAKPNDPDSQNKVHGVGVIASFDDPTIGLVPSGDAANRTSFEEMVWFQEFARLEINGQWYLISDPVKWYYLLKVNNDSGFWQNNGSSTDTGNPAP